MCSNPILFAHFFFLSFPFDTKEKQKMRLQRYAFLDTARSYPRGGE